MQNIQMRNAEILNNRRAMKAQQSTSITENAGMGMDAFAMIFEQMALTMQEDEIVITVPEEDGFAGVTEEDSDSLDLSVPPLPIMEMAVSEVLIDAQWAAFVEQDDASAVEMLSALNLPADVKQFLLNTRTAAQLFQSNGLEQSFEQTVEEEQQPIQQTQSSGDAQMGTSEEKPFVEILSKPADGEGDSEPLQGLQNTFLKNVRAAKFLLNAKPVAKELPQVDIDKLQNDVMSNRFNPMASMENRVAHADFNQQDAPEVDQQIQKGITENLINGRKEFVIKLRPEGLGEVTVKLLERPGEASVLSLITSSAESAKLINQKLSVLQEAMRPLQVQVNMAAPDQSVEASQAGSEAHNQQSFLFDQNQSEQNQQHGQRSSRSSSGKVFSLTDDSLLTEEIAEEQLVAEGLDRYI